jgi:hypothetical protein
LVGLFGLVFGVCVVVVVVVGDVVVGGCAFMVWALLSGRVLTHIRGRVTVDTKLQKTLLEESAG